MKLHHGMHMIRHCNKKRTNPDTALLAIFDRFKHLDPNHVVSKLIDATPLTADRDKKSRMLILQNNHRGNFVFQIDPTGEIVHSCV
jgi:hypothetical protein